MFDFGEELTVESYRIPWLIWIQVFVTFLLILLLYCLASISLDPNPISSTSSSSRNHLVSKDTTHTRDLTAIMNLSQNTQVASGTTTTSRRPARRVDIHEDRGNQPSVEPTNVHFHPCYYVRLARTAFLKCLGLDSSSENSPTVRGRKKKEE